MKEAPGFLEYDYDDNELYHIENMSLDEPKGKHEWRNCLFECEQKNKYGI